MRLISTISLTLLVIAGCGGPSNNGVNPNPPQPKAPTTKVTGREGPALPALMLKKTGGESWKPLSLTPQESDAFAQALKKAPQTTTGGTRYIEAYLKDRQLVFSPEKEPPTLTGKEPEIAMGTPNSPNHSIPVKLIASPSVMKLLEQKTTTAAR